MSGAVTWMRGWICVGLFWLILKIMPRDPFREHFIDAVAGIRARYRPDTQEVG